MDQSKLVSALMRERAALRKTRNELARLKRQHAKAELAHSNQIHRLRADVISASDGYEAMRRAFQSMAASLERERKNGELVKIHK